jgi:hypothetical protein
MSRTRILVVNLICWFCGVLFVLVGGWVLDRTLGEGITKTIVWWLLVGLAVTLFGGVSRVATRENRAISTD